jgi:hypothetical protein
MRIDIVSLEMPFSCDDLIVRIISNGLTWDSTTSSRVCIDQDGKCVCPVNFCITDDAIIAIYSSSFVRPVASLAFHTLVSLLVYFNFLLQLSFGFQFLPPASHTMVLPLEELDLHSFRPEPHMPFQVASILPFIFSVNESTGSCCHVAVRRANNHACLRWRISIWLFRGVNFHVKRN